MSERAKIDRLYLERKIRAEKSSSIVIQGFSPVDEKPLQTQSPSFEFPGEISVTNGEITINLAWEHTPFPPGLFDLTKFTLSSTGGFVDMKDVLPDGWVVSFNPDREEKDASSTQAEKWVKILGIEPTSAEFALSLLHEIGHARDTKYPDTDKFFEEMSMSELADYLRGERAAWAFTLNLIKPLISLDSNSSSEFSWVNIRRIIHQESLGLSTSQMQELIRPPSRKSSRKAA